MTRQRSSTVLLCEICGSEFNPWEGREVTSRVCSLSCNGKLRHREAAKDELAKFMKRISVRDDGCWIWTGQLNDQGYGMFAFKGERERAHRASIRLLKNIDPADKEVCHDCDNPPCVNPDHLFLGTHAENMADMAKKGRQSGPSPERVLRGTRHPLHKLTTSQVEAIRSMPGKQRDIAAIFGVSQAAISSIKNGHHRQHG